MWNANFPDGYHGKKKNSNFFEGWYFKVTNKDATETFAFIPGVFYGKEQAEHHGFLQVLEGNAVRYSYLKFPESAFRGAEKELSVQLEDNFFSKEKIMIQTQLNATEELRVDLEINNPKEWKSTRINPGSMGFFNYIHFMECYMQTCLMHGTLSGAIQIGPKVIDMTGGHIYIEKNWGRSFPKAWVWIQASSFEKLHKEAGPVSLSCAVGKVPFLGLVFDGFLIGLTIGETFYEFTTNNLSKIKLELSKEIPEVTVKNRKYQLIIKTFAAEDSFMLCKGPTLAGEMAPFVKESLQGEVKITLVDRKSGNVIYSGVSKATGIELTNRDLFNK